MRNCFIWRLFFVLFIIANINIEIFLSSASVISKFKFTKFLSIFIYRPSQTQNVTQTTFSKRATSKVRCAVRIGRLVLLSRQQHYSINLSKIICRLATVDWHKWKHSRSEDSGERLCRLMRKASPDISININDYEDGIYCDIVVR